ncbi:Chloroperoxidase [Gaertneriomyces semiglobifer]|nr:Chloroperoxidase [Gaertneriomyces semiglobifer]
MVSKYIASFFVLATVARAASIPPYQPPGEGDVRSPCPMLNALANHGILPRDGKNIPPAKYVEALSQVGCAKDFCASLAYASVLLVPTRKNEDGSVVFGLDDLRKHGGIEHDASLTRNDFDLSPSNDNYSLNRTLYDQLIANANPKTQRLDTTSMARTRKTRQSHSRVNNPDPDFGPRQFVLAHGESAILLNFFGHQFGNEVPVNFADAVFLEERLPYEEGWVPSKIPLGFIQAGATSAAIAAKEALIKD